MRDRGQFGFLINVDQVRDLLLQESFFPDDFDGFSCCQKFRKRLAGQVFQTVVDLLTMPEQASGIETVFKEKKGREVKMYMVNEDGRTLLAKMGSFLSDLAQITGRFMMPEETEEMGRLLVITAQAVTSQKPVTLYTPVCPDWSRNSQGVYDFNGLGGGESFIAKKYFANISELLSVFEKHEIPYQGMMLFADYGLETEIDVKDSYGQKLSLEDIKMCFQSSFAATDEHLLRLQTQGVDARLFQHVSIVSMNEFLINSGLDLQQTVLQMRQFFELRKGKRLLDVLSKDSLEVNKKRFGLDEVQNREYALQNLVDYATLGQAFDSHGVIVACESRMSSRAYNLPRLRSAHLPLFFLKGKDSLDRGVNIL